MSKPPLPNVTGPTLSCTLPVSGTKIKYRPFVVKEQKALLLAQQSDDLDIVYDTIKSVINTCSNGSVEFDKLSTADVSYFFLQLRIASVGPEVDFALKCDNCDEVINSRLMLDDITIDTSAIVKDVKITDTVGIRFRLPTFDDSFKTVDDDDTSINMIYGLIDCLYDAKQVYLKSDYTGEELKEWLLNLNDSQVAGIDKFISGIPELVHNLEFECTKCGTKHSRRLVGLQSFFRFSSAS